MKITSKIDRVTLFPRGAEITRLAKIELAAGEHEIVIDDLPARLVHNSLRVEGEVDGELELGAIDDRSIHIPKDGSNLDESERQRLLSEIEKLDDELAAVAGRIETAMTQKNLMENLAKMPLSPVSKSGGEQDWGAVFDLIGRSMPKAQENLNALTIKRRELQEKRDDLRHRLTDEAEEYFVRTQVKISARSKSDLTGDLILHYQVHDAGWQPLYDARLVSKEEPEIELVRRAELHQNTEETWENVALTLSTTRPNAGTSAPDLVSTVLDILPNPPMPMASEAVQVTNQALPDGAASMDWMAEAPPARKMRKMRRAVERETKIEQSGFQATFKVPGRVSLSGEGAAKKVRIGGETLKPALKIHATPLLDPTAFLHASFTLEEGLALLPGQVALYRDDVFVGNGHLPLVNAGEKHELGFGADDAVTIKRVELKRQKGRHGLLKSENTDEFHFKITIENHHKRAMPVRILDCLPVANHEKIRIEKLSDMSEASETNVDDKRGLLSFERDLAGGGIEEIILHYRINWPKGERIG